MRNINFAPFCFLWFFPFVRQKSGHDAEKRQVCAGIENVFNHKQYLNTLTISLSPPISLLHLFNRPVSEKPHFSMTFPDAGLPVK